MEVRDPVPVWETLRDTEAEADSEEAPEPLVVIVEVRVKSPVQLVRELDVGLTVGRLVAEDLDEALLVTVVREVQVGECEEDDVAEAEADGDGERDPVGEREGRAELLELIETVEVPEGLVDSVGSAVEVKEAEGEAEGDRVLKAETVGVSEASVGFAERERDIVELGLSLRERLEEGDSVEFALTERDTVALTVLEGERLSVTVAEGVFVLEEEREVRPLADPVGEPVEEALTERERDPLADRLGECVPDEETVPLREERRDGEDEGEGVEERVEVRVERSEGAVEEEREGRSLDEPEPDRVLETVAEEDRDPLTVPEGVRERTAVAVELCEAPFDREGPVVPLTVRVEVWDREPDDVAELDRLEEDERVDVAVELGDFVWTVERVGVEEALTDLLGRGVMLPLTVEVAVLLEVLEAVSVGVEDIVFED